MTRDTGNAPSPPARGPSGDGNHDAKPFASPLPDSTREESPERADDRREPGTTQPAGPHSQPSLTNPEATPGAGTLPDVSGGEGEDGDTDAATG